MSNPYILPIVAAVLLLIALAVAVAQPVHWERSAILALVLGLIVGGFAYRQRRGAGGIR